MSTSLSAVRPTPAQSTASDVITYGPVHLDVIDLERSLAFWRDLIGLRELQRTDGAARLGVEDAELVVLRAGATERVRRGHAGLYHLAIHLPSEAEFARVLARVFRARFPNAPTDHVMHWATYLDDPDGIGLELSFETLDRFGRYDLASRRPGIVDSRGRLQNAVAPLDLDEVFSHLPDDDLNRPLAPATRIGHIHLHVPELESAVRFYEAVGFGHGVSLPIGMAELHAHGSFPHRLALNVWQGVGAPPPPEGTAGLRHVVVRVRSQEDVEAAINRLGEIGDVETVEGGAVARDPGGNRVHVISEDSPREQ
jgi:catechol 2,3-dioxygenase